MAEHKFTCALNPATIPFLANFQKRPVIVAGIDNKLRAANLSQRDTETDNNFNELPSILHAQNIMPTLEGVMSVGFNAIQAQVGGETLFDEVFQLRDVDENVKYYSPCAGKNYVTPAFGTAWSSTNPLAGAPVGNEVSVAYVNGVTWVCFAGLALLRWDGAAFIDETANLVNVLIADVVAITGSGTYLILLCDDLSYKWSSTTDPLDFTPDDVTGAGSQIPVDVKGKPVALTTVSGGVIIHCTQNAVMAFSTNNANAPWTFREIKNAGGISSRKNISTDNNTGATYIWGTNGFQQVGVREAENLFPALTDFLGGRVLDSFSTTTKLFTVTRLSSDLAVKIGYVAGRYIVVSYGTTAGAYSAALIYDTGLKRWGKVVTDHVDCFSSYSGARQSICFLKDTGVVNQLVMDDRTFTDAGILIMGRYQLSRASNICSEECVLQVLDSTDNPVVQVLANFDGDVCGHSIQMTPAVTNRNYRLFQGQIEAENLSYLITGNFRISTMMLTVTKGAASGS